MGPYKLEINLDEYSTVSQTWLIRRTTINNLKYLFQGLTPSHLNQNLLGKVWESISSCSTPG